MSFTNDEMANIIGHAVLDILDEQGLQITWNQNYFIRSLKKTQQEEETMNVDANNTEFKLVPTPVVPLTDAEVEKLLAAKSLDGTAAYLTDADETDDEASGLADFGPETKPTIH